MSALLSFVHQFANEDLSRLDDRSLEQDVVEVARAIDMLSAQLMVRIAEIDRRKTFAFDGFLSTQAWVASACDMGAGTTRRKVAVAQSLESMPETAARFSAGDISNDKVSILADAVDAYPGRFSIDEPMLLGFADDLSVADFRKAVTYWKHLQDQEAAVTDSEAFRSRRWLHISQTFEGMVRIDGQLDRESGEVVIEALAAATTGADRAAAGSARAGEPIETASTRRADGLVEICRRWLDGGGMVAGGERPHVTVTVDLEMLESRRGTRSELARTGVITAEAARRVACDAGITRVIVGPASEPLDVGRRTRTISAAQRKALNLRDTECRFPGCDRPPPWCDGHHIRHWVDGGPTNLDNLVLLCRRHHRLVHEGGFGVRCDAERLVFTRPDRSEIPQPET